MYVDGGIRCGLDVLAALALGADAVFLGRLPVWALVEGEAGVARMHADLRARRPSRRSGWPAAATLADTAECRRAPGP